MSDRQKQRRRPQFALDELEGRLLLAFNGAGLTLQDTPLETVSSPSQRTAYVHDQVRGEMYATPNSSLWGNFEPNTGFRYVDKGRFSFHDAEGSPWETIYVKNTQSIDQEAEHGWHTDGYYIANNATGSDDTVIVLEDLDSTRINGNTGVLVYNSNAKRLHLKGLTGEKVIIQMGSGFHIDELIIDSMDATDVFVDVYNNGGTIGQIYKNNYVNDVSSTNGLRQFGGSPYPVTTGLPSGIAPPTPTLNSATATSSSSITLNWTDVSGETAYKVERSTGGGAWSQVAVTAPDATGYTDTGLNAGTSYSYRVRAYNPAGSGQHSSYSATKSATTSGSSGGGGTLYEAESATRHNVWVATNHAGYTGSGFADYNGTSGDHLQFTVNAPSAGVYELDFRYANGTSDLRNLELKVNGSVANSALSFGYTGGWAVWDNRLTTVSLQAGSNTIRLTSFLDGGGGANIDSLTVRH